MIKIPAPCSKACFERSITFEVSIVPVPTIMGSFPFTAFTAVSITLVRSSKDIIDASPVVPRITTPSVPAIVRNIYK